MAKTNFKTTAKTDTQTSKPEPCHVIVLNDAINFQSYVVVAFTKVLRVGAVEAIELMLLVHTEGRAIVWTGTRERAELMALELQQWHLDARIDPNA